MDLHRGVAARLAALALTRRRTVSEADICSGAVHCGLLVDLVLAGVLDETDDAVLVDPAPTGFAPADALLGLLVDEPGRTLGEWVEDPRTGLVEVVDALVGAGVWSVEHRRWRPDRYRVDDAVRARDLQLADEFSPADVASAPSATDGAVAVLADAAGMLGRARERGWHADPLDLPGSFLAATGAARPTCEAGIAYLTWARQWRPWGRGVPTLAFGAPGPPG